MSTLISQDVFHDCAMTTRNGIAAILMNDLESMVRRMMTGAVTITSQPRQENYKYVWTIQSFEKDPVIVLQYQCKPVFGKDEETTLVSIKTEPVDDCELEMTSPKNEPRFSVVEDREIRLISIQNPNIGSNCVSLPNAGNAERSLNVENNVSTSTAIDEISVSEYTCVKTVQIKNENSMQTSTNRCSDVLSKNENVNEENVSIPSSQQVEIVASDSARENALDLNDKTVIEKPTFSNANTSLNTCQSKYGDSCLKSSGVDCTPQESIINQLSSSSDTNTSSENAYECKYCQKLFQSVVLLETHMKCHSEQTVERRLEKVHQCTECARKFTQLCHLRFHMKSHARARPYQCNECDKSFAQLKHLKTHVRVHTGERPFQCVSCDKSFNYLTNLKAHERVHTKERPYKCMHCSKQFLQLGHLRDHETLHTRVRRYQCSDCNKTFTQLSSLKLHERIHTGEKPFECPHCDKKFAQLGNLKQHEKVHTGEKSYQCTHCSKRFSHTGNLKKHEQIHSKQEFYVCCHCKNSFTDLSDLKVKEGVDEGETTYTCSQCELKLKQFSNLRTYERVYTRQKHQ